MSARENAPKIALPRGWSDNIKSAMLHVISLAQFGTAYVHPLRRPAVEGRLSRYGQGEDCADALSRRSSFGQDNRRTHLEGRTGFTTDVGHREHRLRGGRISGTDCHCQLPQSRLGAGFDNHSAFRWAADLVDAERASSMLALLLVDIGRPTATVRQGILGQSNDVEDSGFDVCAPALGEWDLRLLVLAGHLGLQGTACLCIP